MGAARMKPTARFFAPPAAAQRQGGLYPIPEGWVNSQCSLVGQFSMIVYNLTVKEHYWRWASRKLQGNAIDLLMLLEGRTFTETMSILCPKD